MLQEMATRATKYHVGVGDGVIASRVKVENSWNRNIKWLFLSNTAMQPLHRLVEDGRSEESTGSLT